MIRKRPKTIIKERSSHTVSRKDIDENAVNVLYRLTRKGYTAYLVGGGVRDLLLGRNPKDFDVSTDARPRQIQRLFRTAYLIGRRFRLVHVKFGDVVIETSTFRCQPDPAAQTDDGSLYHNSDNTYGTPEEDARRRDFTINALFYDITTFSVIDHVGGLRDLDRGIVRCIGDPDVRFQEDPVRMLRAVRFAARLGFTIERKTLKSITKYRDHIAITPAARLLEEVYRLFPFKSGKRAIKLLQETRLLRAMMPELDTFLKRGNNALFWNCLEALDELGDDEGTPPNPALIFSVLVYPEYKKIVERESAKHGRVDELQIARDVMAPFVERLKPPRRVFFDTIHMLAGQKRFQPDRRHGSPERFAAHPDFPVILALHEVIVMAEGGDLAKIAEWKDLLEKVQPAEKRAKRERDRRPRRRPRRRKPSGDGKSGGKPGGKNTSSDKRPKSSSD